YRCGISVAETYLLVREIHRVRVINRVRDYSPFLMRFAFARLPRTSKRGGSSRLQGGESLTRTSTFLNRKVLSHLLLLCHLELRLRRGAFLRGQPIVDARA